MASSPDKIRVSHAGTLPRPDGLKEELMAGSGSAGRAICACTSSMGSDPGKGSVPVSISYRTTPIE